MRFNLLTLSAKCDTFKIKEIKMITYNDLFAEKYRPKTLNDMILTPDVRTFFEEIFFKTGTNYSQFVVPWTPRWRKNHVGENHSR